MRITNFESPELHNVDSWIKENSDKVIDKDIKKCQYSLCH